MVPSRRSEAWRTTPTGFEREAGTVYVRYLLPTDTVPGGGDGNVAAMCLSVVGTSTSPTVRKYLAFELGGSSADGQLVSRHDNSADTSSIRLSNVGQLNESIADDDDDDDDEDDEPAGNSNAISTICCASLSTSRIKVGSPPRRRMPDSTTAALAARRSLSRRAMPTDDAPSSAEKSGRSKSSRREMNGRRAVKRGGSARAPAGAAAAPPRAPGAVLAAAAACCVRRSVATKFCSAPTSSSSSSVRSSLSRWRSSRSMRGALPGPAIGFERNSTRPLVFWPATYTSTSRT